MFRQLRRLWESWKKSLYDSYEPKPTVYRIGKKKYIKKKIIGRPKGQKGPYLKYNHLLFVNFVNLNLQKIYTVYSVRLGFPWILCIIYYK